MRGLWSRRSPLGLVGAHIDVFSGEWTQKDAGIGTSVDSFYEYLLKAHLLLGEEEFLHMFRAAYESALQHLHHPPWYWCVGLCFGVVVMLNDQSAWYCYGYGYGYDDVAEHSAGLVEFVQIV